MNSSGRSESLDLERGLPTTPEDVEALRRAAVPRAIGLAEYLEFLSQLPPVPFGDGRWRRIEAADRPFSLTD